jgi:hypothetical protein
MPMAELRYDQERTWGACGVFVPAGSTLGLGPFPGTFRALCCGWRLSSARPIQVVLPFAYDRLVHLQV